MNAAAQQSISPLRLKFIRAQGYHRLSDADLSEIAFGNRFAYIPCTLILTASVATAYIPGLFAMAAVAFLSIVLPYHPFDYVYNHGLRKLLDKPLLPPRSIQLKFACAIATLWIVSTACLFHAGLASAGYVMGGLLAAVAVTVSTTDFCLPSVIFNYLFKIDGSGRQGTQGVTATP